MTNEAGIPETGLGPEGKFTVKVGNRDFDIRYVVNIRTGATPEMVGETIRHFKHAVQVAARGHDKIAENVPPRTVYADKLEHGQARVSIWTKGSFVPIPDFNAGLIYKVPVNICNEYTGAQDLVDRLLMVADLMVEGANGLETDFVAAGSIIDVNAPEDLNKWFPRDGQKQPATKDPKQTATAAKGNYGQQRRTPGQVPPQQSATGQQPAVHPLARQGSNRKVEIVHLGDYSYQLQDEYEKAFAGSGKWISFDIAKMTRMVKAKNDGTGTYECIDIYPYYGEGPSDYPISSARIFPHPEGRDFSDWKTLFDKCITDTQTLAEPGTTWEGPMVVSWGLSISKNDGRIFWNLKEITPILNSDHPQPDPPSENDMPDWGRDDPAPEDSGHIPDEPPWAMDEDDAVFHDDYDANESEVDF